MSVKIQVKDYNVHFKNVELKVMALALQYLYNDLSVYKETADQIKEVSSEEFETVEKLLEQFKKKKGM